MMKTCCTCGGRLNSTVVCVLFVWQSRCDCVHIERLVVFLVDFLSSVTRLLYFLGWLSHTGSLNRRCGSLPGWWAEPLVLSPSFSVSYRRTPLFLAAAMESPSSRKVPASFSFGVNSRAFESFLSLRLVTISASSTSGPQCTLTDRQLKRILKHKLISASPPLFLTFWVSLYSQEGSFQSPIP